MRGRVGLERVGQSYAIVFLALTPLSTGGGAGILTAVEGIGLGVLLGKLVTGVGDRVLLAAGFAGG